jgi:hypothetical protein
MRTAVASAPVTTSTYIGRSGAAMREGGRAAGGCLRKGILQ